MPCSLVGLLSTSEGELEKEFVEKTNVIMMV